MAWRWVHLPRFPRHIAAGKFADTLNREPVVALSTANAIELFAYISGEALAFHREDLPATVLAVCPVPLGSCDLLLVITADLNCSIYWFPSLSIESITAQLLAKETLQVPEKHNFDTALSTPRLSCAQLPDRHTFSQCVSVCWGSSLVHFLWLKCTLDGPKEVPRCSMVATYHTMLSHTSTLVGERPCAIDASLIPGHPGICPLRRSPIAAILLEDFEVRQDKPLVHLFLTAPIPPQFIDGQWRLPRPLAEEGPYFVGNMHPLTSFVRPAFPGAGFKNLGALPSAPPECPVIVFGHSSVHFYDARGLQAEVALAAPPSALASLPGTNRYWVLDTSGNVSLLEAETATTQVIATSKKARPFCSFNITRCSELTAAVSAAELGPPVEIAVIESNAFVVLCDKGLVFTSGAGGSCATVPLPATVQFTAFCLSTTSVGNLMETKAFAADAAGVRLRSVSLACHLRQKSHSAEAAFGAIPFLFAVQKWLFISDQHCTSALNTETWSPDIIPGLSTDPSVGIFAAGDHLVQVTRNQITVLCQPRSSADSWALSETRQVDSNINLAQLQGMHLAVVSGNLVTVYQFVAGRIEAARSLAVDKAISALALVSFEGAHLLLVSQWLSVSLFIVAIPTNGDLQRAASLDLPADPLSLTSATCDSHTRIVCGLADGNVAILSVGKHPMVRLEGIVPVATAPVTVTALLVSTTEQPAVLCCTTQGNSLCKLSSHSWQWYRVAPEISGAYHSFCRVPFLDEGNESLTLAHIIVDGTGLHLAFGDLELEPSVAFADIALPQTAVPCSATFVGSDPVTNTVTVVLQSDQGARLCVFCDRPGIAPFYGDEILDCTFSTLRVSCVGGSRSLICAGYATVTTPIGFVSLWEVSFQGTSLAIEPLANLECTPRGIPKCLAVIPSAESVLIGTDHGLLAFPLPACGELTVAAATALQEAPCGDVEQIEVLREPKLFVALVAGIARVWLAHTEKSSRLAIKDLSVTGEDEAGVLLRNLSPLPRRELCFAAVNASGNACLFEAVATPGGKYRCVLCKEIRLAAFTAALCAGSLGMWENGHVLAHSEADDAIAVTLGGGLANVKFFS
eukprot:TRINITY_DN4343_c0_g1_i1.p1 TRINITY_DN4343_c0_g1~~TRINITY_DN4343_c0_g1_i1.p1  ORF type:complete len:1083 (+),score=108.20 TRINITY_DN4343_c0_g1_i1:872-4120(+)